MTLKKFLRMLKNQRGQSSVEFFVLFSIVAVLTLLSLTTFYPKIQNKGDEVFTSLSGRIVAPTLVDAIFNWINPGYINREPTGWGSGQLQDNATDQWEANPQDPLDPAEALENSTVPGLAGQELSDLSQGYSQLYGTNIIRGGH